MTDQPSDRPITADREQQRADNLASRRQSGLEPEPRDREPDTRTGQDPAEQTHAERAGDGGDAT